jgi:hypothetical protein
MTESTGLSYVYDEQGNKTGVIVPIHLWVTKYAKSDDPEEKPFDPVNYRGIYRNLRVDPREEGRKLRDEWERV